MATAKTPATRLTDTHLVILSAAAQRAGGRVLPIPESVGNRGGSATRALNGLLRRELITEIPANPEDVEWSRNEDGQRLTLAITDAGLAAIGVEGEAADAADDIASPDDGVRSDEPAAADDATPAETDQMTASPLGAQEADVDVARSPAKFPTPPAFRAGTKGAALVELLRRKTGAALPDLMAASGWQAHSVRGFLSGTLKKKHGLVVESQKGEDGQRRYRIAA